MKTAKQMITTKLNFPMSLSNITLTKGGGDTPLMCLERESNMLMW